jgi:cytidine deaminase
MNEERWAELEQAAKAAALHAYCPYSRFVVGCAVMTGDGAIASGCNVENASFGLTSCAERNAICRAVCDGATAIAALVVYTRTAAPVSPCGACRQVIAEFGRDVRIRMICDGPEAIEHAIDELLPATFTLTKPG